MTTPEETLALLAELQQRIDALRERMARVAFLDPIDLRFRNRIRVPVPTSKAVMFCLMDVSGSMDEGRKELSKRFFILLYLFLTRTYEHIDIVFIRHHTQAAEVDDRLPLVAEVVAARREQPIEAARSDVHGAERVRVARVRRAREGQVGEAELLGPVQVKFTWEQKLDEARSRSGKRQTSGSQPA